MEMHTYFTEIPKRSFEAMVFEGYFSEVLLALIVDPHEAEDVAQTIQDIRETQIELAVGNEIINAPITLSDFQNLPSKHAFEQLKITLAQWAMTTKSANFSLQTLSKWDQRFAVWCSCAVAREALRFVRKGEQRPLRSIEAAEAWVRGRVAIDEVRLAYEAAYEAAEAASEAGWDADWDAASEAFANACLSAASAAYASDDGIYATASAFGITSAAESAFKSATYAATVTAVIGRYRQIDIDAAYAVELIRLREVVANACLSFPG